MPVRKEPLVTDYFYHVLNRGARSAEIFKDSKDKNIFLELLTFYSQTNPPAKFSYYRIDRKKYQVDFSERLVTIVSYCLMPTHFHLFLRQEEDQGVKTFLQRVSNAYSHYHNLRHNYKGALFEGPFKSIGVDCENQFLHLSRYIHLNPVSAYLVDDPCDYPFSSCNLFVRGSGLGLPFDPSPVMSGFKNGEDYLDFLLAGKDYQRELASIKDLLLEE
ncbi:MAG: transposase [Patescibacteria group bacterium]|nr:transposase [Patescibacteria group bacterium]